jgi:hypothetical protein
MISCALKYCESTAKPALQLKRAQIVPRASQLTSAQPGVPDRKGSHRRRKRGFVSFYPVEIRNPHRVHHGLTMIIWGTVQWHYGKEMVVWASPGRPWGRREPTNRSRPATTHFSIRPRQLDLIWADFDDNERQVWGMKSRSRCEGGTAKKDRGWPAGSRILDLRTGYGRQ